MKGSHSPQILRLKNSHSKSVLSSSISPLLNDNKPLLSIQITNKSTQMFKALGQPLTLPIDMSQIYRPNTSQYQLFTQGSQASPMLSPKQQNLFSSTPKNTVPSGFTQLLNQNEKVSKHLHFPSERLNSQKQNFSPQNGMNNQLNIQQVSPISHKKSYEGTVNSYKQLRNIEKADRKNNTAQDFIKMDSCLEEGPKSIFNRIGTETSKSKGPYISFQNNKSCSNFFSSPRVNDAKEKRDTENDLFSTNRKEYKATELLKTKFEQEIQKQGIQVPKKSEKLLKCSSYLTSKLNPYYEQTMNLVNELENRKFGLEETFKQYQNQTIIQKSQLKSLNTEKSPKEEHSDGQNCHFINLKVGEQPLELVSKQVNVISAKALEFFYLFINVKLFPTPIKVNFKTQLGKIKVFISKSTPFPSKFSHDEILQSNLIKFDDGNNKKFTFDKLFFGVLSDIEQEIKITFRFGQDKSTYFYNTRLTDDQDSQSKLYSKKLAQIPVAISILAQDVAEIKEKRKLKMMKFKDGLEKNFQQENIDYISSFTPDQHKSSFQEKTFQFNSRHREVYEKKQQIDEQLYFKKDFNQKCKDFQKKINQVSSVMQAKKEKRVLLSNTWAAIILQVLSLSKGIDKIQRKILPIKKIKKKLEVSSKQIIPDVENRTLFQCKQSLQLVCLTLKKKVKEKAKKIVVNILMSSRNTCQFTGCLMNHIKTVNKIAARWRKFKLKKEHFQNFLGFLFDKYFSKVLETISKQASVNEDFSSQILNAKRIDKQKTDQTRLKFIELYFERRRQEYSRALIKYLQLYNQDKNRKILYLQTFLKKRKDEEVDFQKTNFSSVNEEGEDQIDSILFNQDLDKKRDESLAIPRYFVVPSYEILKQVIKQTFEEIHDKQLVKRLKQEQIAKNWSQSYFLKKLLMHEEAKPIEQ